MKSILAMSILLIANSLLASPSDKSLMTFMRETVTEKQIMLSKADGSSLTAITKGKLWHLYPAISPSAEEVTFVAGENEASLHLVTQNLESGIQEQWTIESQKGLNLHPSYSGNGKWLVFSSGVAGGKNQISFFNIDEARKNSAQVMIDSEDGPRKAMSPKMETINLGVSSFFPNFSSDASFIVFQRSLSATNKDIVLYDLATKKMENITDANGYSMAPALSPDDRFIAYTSKIDNNWDIYVKERATGKVIRVTEDAGQDFAPTFNANNSLIFSSNRSGNFNLYKTSYVSWFNGVKDESNLITGSFDDYSPSLSGDKSFAQKELTSFGDPARSSFGAIRVGDRVYIAGGHQGHEHTYPPESFMNKVEYYDLKTKVWKEAAPRLNKCHGFSLASSGKYIYAFGGFAYEANNNPKWKSLDVIERYDTETDQWTVIGSMPRKRSSNVVVTLGNQAYLIGGWDSTPKTPGDLEGTFLKAIDVFDFKTETMTEAHFSMPNPLRRAFSAVAYNGKIILVGGLGVGSSHFELLSNVTELDPNTGTIRELKSLPFPTFAPAAGIIGTELFVFGGMFKLSAEEYNYVSHIYSLDLPTNKWSHSGRYLSENKGFSQVVDIDSHTLGILGGHTYKNDDDTPVSTFEIFHAK
ncbi:MAG: Kelch repeat-containing protein [Bacteriovoracaceae bacterium]